ncbi:human gut microbiome secreted protein [uncultured phage cr19_1]|uniref:Gut microbiome secreted protein n=1 Tax=uncultured phage cr19_1 TaxID=2986420 RepID=A0AA48WWH4_9CAUD|nr:human gut microbiome secreted protein [uncultured phage cr19_1]
MSNEIATYSMILSKLSLGQSGTECPTKTQILAINSLIVIENASTYGANECVKIDDIRKKVETWNYYLTVSPTSMSFGAGGGSKSFTVSSYKRKVLNGVEQSGDTNVSLKSTTISGTGFSLSGTTVSASANEGTSNRTGTVTITQNESNKTATISLSQSGDTISSYGEWTISVSANPTSVSSDGGTSRITASAKRTVYWASGDVTEETGNPTLSTNLGSLSSTSSPSTLTLGENTSTSSRTATIKATHGGKSATCTVTQAGAEPTIEYVFTISPWQVNVGASGGTGDIGFTSYKLVNGNQISLGYSIDSSTLPSWATYSNGRFTISSNSSTSSRSANVYFTQSESGKTQSIEITQSGYTPTYTFNVTPTNLSVTAAETNETLTVNSYKTVLKSDGSETTESLNYEFSSNASWVNAARTTTNTTYITVAQNLTTNQRSAKITLTQAESGAQVFTNVIQAGQQVVDNKLTLTSITYSTAYLFPSGQTPVEGETVYLGFMVPNTFTWKTSNGLAINRGTIYAGNIGNIYVRENDRYKLVKSFQLQTGDQTISF